jgi:hypothetical protein
MQTRVPGEDQNIESGPMEMQNIKDGHFLITYIPKSVALIGADIESAEFISSTKLATLFQYKFEDSRGWRPWAQEVTSQSMGMSCKIFCILSGLGGSFCFMVLAFILLGMHVFRYR